MSGRKVKSSREHVLEGKEKQIWKEKAISYLIIIGKFLEKTVNI